jgi:hypothetical protein
MVARRNLPTLPATNRLWVNYYIITSAIASDNAAAHSAGTRLARVRAAACPLSGQIDATLILPSRATGLKLV